MNSKIIKRNQNIETVRIFAMFLIVLGHVSCFMRGDSTSSLFRTVMAPLSFFLAYHVDLFVLISGYCGIKSLKSVGKLWKLNFSWLLVVVVLNAFFSFGNFDYSSLVFSLSGNPWWFMRIYFLLTLVAPVLLNPCLAALDKKELDKLLAVFLLIDVYLSFGCRMETIYFGGYDLIHFITIYIIGFWMKTTNLLNFSWKEKKFGAFHFFMLFILILLLKSIVRLCFGSLGIHGRFWEYNNPFNILLAVCAFLFFLKLKIKDCKGILFISSSVIGVYLFSEHPLIRTWLVDTFNAVIVHCAHNPILEFLFVLVFIAGIFIVAITLDKIRKIVVDGVTNVFMKVTSGIRLNVNNK